MKPSSCQLFIKMLAIIFLVLLTSFFVIVYPLFLQPAEKLESEQQKQTTLIKNIKTKDNKTKETKTRKISQEKQNRLKEIEQDFEQGKINSKEYQKLIVAINKEFV